MTSAPPDRPKPSELSDRSLLDRFLGLFADVRAGEGFTAIVLTLDVMLVLVAYYLLKTAREPLILAGGGVELKGYTTAGQAVLLMGFVPVYAVLTKRLSRMVLITATHLFFAANLVIFWVLALLKTPYLGVAFFLWLGCFSLTIIAQFWSFANDLYTPEQGKRLFAIVGVGSSLGAVAGSYLAKELVKPIGPYQMMLVSAVILVVCLGMTWYVNQRESDAASAREKAGAKKEEKEQIGGKNGFSLIFEDRYLLLIAGVILILNLVNTMGESVLDLKILEAANAAIDPGLVGEAREAAIGDYVGEFRGDFFFWVNLAGAIVQMFFVSRIFKYIGLRIALLSLPVIGLLGYGFIAFAAPAIAIVRVVKIIENSTDYSLYNTVKQALWLPTTRAQKYNAKMATDTFIVRAGDFVSGLAVPALIGLGFAAQQFAMVNVGAIILWIIIALALGRENDKRTQAMEAAGQKPGG